MVIIRKYVMLFPFIGMLTLSNCGNHLSKQKVKNFEYNVLMGDSMNTVVNYFFNKRIDTLTFALYDKSEIFLMYGFGKDSVMRFNSMEHLKTSSLPNQEKYTALLSIMKQQNISGVSFYNSKILFSFNNVYLNSCFELIYEPNYINRYDISTTKDFIKIQKKWYFPVDSVWYFKESDCFAY